MRMLPFVEGDTLMPNERGLAGSSPRRPCPACGQPSDDERARRFGGRRVCLDCWQGLARLERSWAYRGLPRASLLAHFAAEVAVRLARVPEVRTV